MAYPRLGSPAVCTGCGESFYAAPSRRRTYCSIKCYWQHRPVTQQRIHLPPQFDLVKLPATLQMSWEYIAGFIDGEGTLTFSPYKCGGLVTAWLPQLIAFQKRGEVLFVIRDFIGTGSVRTTSNDQNKLEINGRKRLTPIIRSLAPLLIVKRRNAEILLNFFECRERTGGRNRPYDEHCMNLIREMALHQIGGRRRVFSDAVP